MRNYMIRSTGGKGMLHRKISSDNGIFPDSIERNANNDTIAKAEIIGQ